MNDADPGMANVLIKRGVRSHGHILSMYKQWKSLPGARGEYPFHNVPNHSFTPLFYHLICHPVMASLALYLQRSDPIFCAQLTNDNSTKWTRIILALSPLRCGNDNDVANRRMVSVHYGRQYPLLLQREDKGTVHWIGSLLTNPIILALIPYKSCNNTLCHCRKLYGNDRIGILSLPRSLQTLYVNITFYIFSFPFILHHISETQKLQNSKNCKEQEEEQKEKMSPDPLPIPVDQSDGIDRMESIPFGNTPFPNMPPPGGIREENEDSDSSDDDQMEDSPDSTKNAAVDINEYFMTDKDRQNDKLQYDPQHNSTLPPSKLTYPANELELRVQSKMDSLHPRLASMNIGSCTFQICPALPEGMDFDVDTGILSGFPMECIKKQQFTITATNEVGSTAVKIEIVIKPSESSAHLQSVQDGEEGKTVTFGFNAQSARSKQRNKGQKPQCLIMEKVEYQTKEEALAAFEELLANKGVRPQSTWNSIQLKLRRDSRFFALDTEMERKRAFSRYKRDLIFASGDIVLITAEKERLKGIRSDFKQYLRDILTLERLDHIFVSYGVDEDGNERNPNKSDEEQHKKSKSKKDKKGSKSDSKSAGKSTTTASTEDDIVDIEDIENIEQRLDFDELEKEFVGDERYHAMEDEAEERRSMIVDHVQVLEYQQRILREQARERMDMERKQNLVVLLHELSFGKSDPVFHGKTTFKELCKEKEFMNDDRMKVFVEGDDGEEKDREERKEGMRMVEGYFDEFIIAMNHMLAADKQILKSFLRDYRQPIKHSDTVPRLMRYYERSSRLSMIEAPHLRLLFCEMIGKQRYLVDSGVIPSASLSSSGASSRRRSQDNGGHHAGHKRKHEEYAKSSYTSYSSNHYGSSSYQTSHSTSYGTSYGSSYDSHRDRRVDSRNDSYSGYKHERDDYRERTRDRKYTKSRSRSRERRNFDFDSRDKRNKQSQSSSTTDNYNKSVRSSTAKKQHVLSETGRASSGKKRTRSRSRSPPDRCPKNKKLKKNEDEKEKKKRSKRGEIRGGEEGSRSSSKSSKSKSSKSSKERDRSTKKKKSDGSKSRTPTTKSKSKRSKRSKSKSTTPVVIRLSDAVRPPVAKETKEDGEIDSTEELSSKQKRKISRSFVVFVVVISDQYVSIQMMITNLNKYSDQTTR